MNRFGKIAVWFAGGLALNAGLCLSLGALSGNPYEPIVTRNIFDLNPPQANAAPAPVQPPSKITLNGIMNIFGTRQALFYVEVPPRPPEPATQKSYILSEGQQQDDIEVTHIDDKKGVVTFNNHGVEQDIPLVKAAPVTTPTPVVMNTARFSPPAPRYNPGQNSAGNYGSAQTQPRLSPEEQMIMMAAQHAEAQKRGDPMAAIFPPTELDEAAGVQPPPQPGN